MIVRLMFWFTDSDMFNVVEMNQLAAKNLRNAMERHVSDDDLKLLQDAHMHMYSTSSLLILTPTMTICSQSNCRGGSNVAGDPELRGYTLSSVPHTAVCA
jgi:hypothetical protein